MMMMMMMMIMIVLVVMTVMVMMIVPNTSIFYSEGLCKRREHLVLDRTTLLMTMMMMMTMMTMTMKERKRKRETTLYLRHFEAEEEEEEEEEEEGAAWPRQSERRTALPCKHGPLPAAAPAPLWSACDSAGLPSARG